MSRPSSRQRPPRPASVPLLPAALCGVGLALLVLATPSRLGAQEETPGSFGEVIDVRVVNLEAVVTDRDGERVSGLSAEDFVLTVDGRVTPIEYFTEVLGGVARPSADAAARSSLPALEPGAPVGTSYLVFVDEYFTFGEDRDAMLERLAEQVRGLAPEDRMAIVAFDGRQLDMLSTWSQSIPALEQVLTAARRRPSRGRERLLELRQSASSRQLRSLRAARGASDSEPADVLPPPTGSVAAQLDVEEQREVDLVVEHVERAVRAAAATLRGFANPPGRKAMLVLSGGWPYNPAQWVVEDRERAFFTVGEANGDQLYRPLIETANRLGYTLYTVDVPRIAATGGDPSTEGVEAGAATRQLLFQREEDEHGTLLHLAGETGGRAFLGSTAGDALAAAVADTRNYYWLGFTPDWKGDDRRHDVRLEARDPKLRVRSRESFSDLSRQTEVTMMVESTLLFGAPPGGAPLTATLGVPTRAGFGKLSVPLTVQVPLHALTFVPGPEGVMAQGELRFALMDEEGNTSDVPVVPLPFRLKRSFGDEKHFFPYEHRLEMRKRPQQVVVSLYDVASGAILTTRLDFVPPVE